MPKNVSQFVSESCLFRLIITYEYFLVQYFTIVKEFKPLHLILFQ